MLLKDGTFDSAQIEFFRREGYFVAENVFTPEDLEPLRSDLARAIDFDTFLKRRSHYDELESGPGPRRWAPLEKSQG